MSEFVESIDRIVDLLPVERREAFLALAARLQTLPEDDEILMVIEAMGFMSLILRNIPEQIHQIITAASSTGAPDTNAYLISELKQTVTEAINIPAYADMRQLAARWEEQHGLFKTSIHQLTQNLSPSRNSTSASLSFLSGILIGVGVTLAAILLLRHL